MESKNFRLKSTGFVVDHKTRKNEGKYDDVNDDEEAKETDRNWNVILDVIDFKNTNNHDMTLPLYSWECKEDLHEYEEQRQGEEEHINKRRVRFDLESSEKNILYFDVDVEHRAAMWLTEEERLQQARELEETVETIRSKQTIFSQPTDGARKDYSHCCIRGLEYFASSLAVNAIQRRRDNLWDAVFSEQARQLWMNHGIYDDESIAHVARQITQNSTYVATLKGRHDSNEARKILSETPIMAESDDNDDDDDDDENRDQFTSTTAEYIIENWRSIF